MTKKEKQVWVESRRSEIISHSKKWVIDGALDEEVCMLDAVAVAEGLGKGLEKGDAIGFAQTFWLKLHSQLLRNGEYVPQPVQRQRVAL